MSMIVPCREELSLQILLVNSHGCTSTVPDAAVTSVFFASKVLFTEGCDVTMPMNVHKEGITPGLGSYT